MLLLGKYTKNSVDTLTSNFHNLKENLIQQNEEEALKQAENADEKWNNMYNKLAYYIEHNELEKVLH